MTFNSTNHSGSKVLDENGDTEGIFRKLYFGIQSDSTLVFFTILNLFFTVMRFQDFSGMGFLGSIRLPVVLIFVAIILVLPMLSRQWLKPMKLMLVFLVFEAVRGVFGYIVFENLVRNDAWQINILQTIFQYVFSMVFPLVFCFSNGFQLRKLIKVLLFMGFALGLWSLTHGGMGPGGYLGDENDNCFALVALLPLPFVYYSITNNILSRLLCLGTGLMLTLGVAATNSRGGFIGFSLVIIFQFLLSRRKAKWIASAFFLALVALPMIPQKYWNEIYSIKTEAKSNDGTIHERMETWTFITRMWLDPKNTLTGVGLENSRWNLGDYEDSDSGISKRSLAGRAAHSMYFQILGDLGIWGIYIMGGIILISINQLRQVRKQAKKISNLLYSDSLAEKREKLGPLLSSVTSELKFVDLLSAAVLCSWLGALGAGVGVSVAYYPILWLLAGFSMAIYLYWTRIRDTVLTPIIENRIIK